MEQIAEEYSFALKTLNICWEKLINQCSQVQNENVKVYDNMNDINEKYKRVCDDNVRLNTLINDLKKNITILEKKLDEAHEEHKLLSKVSHVIAMEKENSKLRSQLDFWKNRHVVKTTNHELKPNPNTENNITVSETIQNSEECEEEIKEVKDTKEYKEKKIKGIIYMINGVNVYTQQADGTIGEHVAILQTVENGKSKIKWKI
jgi:chromosome segregation ATPase